MEQLANATTDRELVAKVLQGEKQQFAGLMHKHNQRIFRVCFSVMQDEIEAEEAMQAAYVKAFEHLGKFRFEAEFSTWLTRIALNECYARQKKRHRLVADSRAGHNVSDNETPYNVLITNELRSLIEGAINNLPEKYRTVFVLREVEGVSIAEAMACLDLTEANVKVRLHRAKEMLRESLLEIYKSNELFPFHLSRCSQLVEKVMAIIG